jgi:hypothetical protein
MFNFPNNRKLWVGAAGTGILLVAGILAVVSHKNREAAEAQNHPGRQAVATPKKAATPKPVSVSSKVNVTEPTQQLVTVPKGTAITATLGETLATDQNHPGDSFDARLSMPVEIDGKVVIPKGARISGRVVKIKKRELKVALASVVVRGKSYDLETNSIRPSDKSQAKGNTGSTSAANDKKNKNVTTLAAQTQLTFKLAKAITVPVKG